MRTHAATGTAHVGILALQGGFEAHAKILRRLGANPREVRTPPDLMDLDALIIPGGESSVMTLGIEREGLAEPLRTLVSQGTPVLGTCAGMIMLDKDHLGILDLHTARNAFGRQLRSFEADVELAGVSGGPLRAIFIRAPWVAEHGDEVEVLAEVDGHPVAVRQENVLAVAFHPELAGDTRLHELLLALAEPESRTAAESKTGPAAKSESRAAAAADGAYVSGARSRRE